MVASLLRLFHNGLQDYRLFAKDVKIEPFLYILHKAGRFTTQWQRVDFDTKPAFGSSGVCRLQRKGHLVSRVYLVATMPDIRSPQVDAIAKGGDLFAGPVFGWTNSLGHALCKNVQLDIGGARVEQFDSRLLEILDEYYTPLEKVQNVNNLIKRVPTGFNTFSIGWDEPNTQVVVPLPFWFSKGDISSALPIDGLYVDEAKVSVKFRPVGELYTTPARAIPVEAGQTTGGGDSETQYLSATCGVNTPASYSRYSSGKEVLADIHGTSFYVFDPSGVKIPGLIPEQPDAKFSPIPGVTMPATYVLGDTYLLVEYITLDKPEANRFRQAEFTMPIVQHYLLDPVDTKAMPLVQIPLRIPNPTRHIFFMCQRVEAMNYNAHFLATRDLSGVDQPMAPWWPDVSGLNMEVFSELIPGFSSSDSEPLTGLALLFEGRFVRKATENLALYRSILPSLEMRKSPLLNRYYYCLPFCLQSGYTPGSLPLGEANFDRISNLNLSLHFAPLSPMPQYTVYSYVETYNILKMFGGRAGLLFGY
jgi:hypothetical protein